MLGLTRPNIEAVYHLNIRERELPSLSRSQQEERSFMFVQMQRAVQWMKGRLGVTIFLVFLLWFLGLYGYWAYGQYRIYKNSPFNNGTIKLETIR